MPGIPSVGCLLLVMLGTSSARPVRSDDETPMEAVVEQLSADVQTLRAELAGQKATIQHLQALASRRVAFSATIPDANPVAPIAASEGTIVPFTHVIVNEGSAFSSATSAFTAPYDGDYFFAVNLDVTGNYKGVAIRRNGHGVVYADHDDATSTHLSMSVVMTLSAGDVVTVNQGSVVGHIDTGADAAFTGFLIH